MSLLDEGQWIRQRITTGWTLGDGSLRTPIAWPNMPGDPPASGEAYIRPSILRSDGETASIGAPASVRHRHYGTVLIEVLTADLTHVAENDTYCDLLEALFRMVSENGFRFYTPVTVPGGTQDGWFKQDVMCPFVRDTIY